MSSDFSVEFGGDAAARRHDACAVGRILSRAQARIAKEVSGQPDFPMQ